MARAGWAETLEAAAVRVGWAVEQVAGRMVVRYQLQLAKHQMRTPLAEN